MLELVKKEWVGGTIIEIGKRMGEVKALMIQGRSGGGNNVENDVGH
jgi:hypothetical protein